MLTSTDRSRPAVDIGRCGALGAGDVARHTLDLRDPVRTSHFALSRMGPANYLRTKGFPSVRASCIRAPVCRA